MKNGIKINKFLSRIPFSQSALIISHIHIGPDVKKKTEEEDVECEDDLILACQPETPAKALDFGISENRAGIMLLNSFFRVWDSSIMYCF